MATIKITFVPQDDLTIFTVKGDLSSNEIMQYSSEYYQLKPTQLVLWDASEGTVENITNEDFKKLASEMRKITHNRVGGKTALLGKFDIDFGLSRMYEAYAEMENVPVTYCSFHNRDDAMSWLKE